MKRKRFVAYYRVSTKKQSLGLSAQKTMVKKYLKNRWPPIAFFIEKESGAKNKRPELIKALDYCFDNKCLLVVAQLDRLSRDLHFITSLEKSGIDFVCCDYPNMDKLQLHIMGSLAQWEREQISKRTSLALQELKTKGKKLGAHNPKVLKGLKKLWKQKRKTKKKREKELLKNKKEPIENKPIDYEMTRIEQADSWHLTFIKTFRKQGMSYKQIAQTLEDNNIPMRRNGHWTAIQVHRIAKRNGVL